MKYHKIQIIFVLFGALAILYVVNIFTTNNISNSLVAKPVQLSFMVIEAPKDACQKCFDVNKAIKMLDTKYNIKYTSNDILYNNPLSLSYIKLYGIKNLPAVVVAGDIKNKDIASAWKMLSGRNENGHIIIENLPPYYNIADKKVRGAVDAILLKDKKCQDCFSENGYITILQKAGVFFNSVKTYDVASTQGKAFVKKYSITKIPTVLLSPDIRVYAGVTSSWKQVGSIGKDGWFIFRSVEKSNGKYEKI